MNKWMPDWLAFAIVSCVLGCFGLGLFGAELVLAATETASMSAVKALYGDGAVDGRTDASQLALPTQASPPSSALPTAAAIPCPDGRTRSLEEILELVRAANPELPIWDEPALAQALSGERGLWKWIKDHVKFTIDAFGLHIQLYNDGFCGQVTVMWWDGWHATWEPC